MGQIRQAPLTWALDGETFEGQLIFSEGGGQRPGLLMAPNWIGVSQGAMDIARQLAGEDYVILIADLYGQGVRPTGPEEAGAAMTPLKNDRILLRRRMQAALAAFKEQAGPVPLDPQRMAAFGFCFGGCCALELARDGAPLKAVISFHGTLDTPTPADAANIQGRVLVLDGAEDPMVPREQLTSFVEEMRQAKVDWQLVSYAGAVHSFTDPEAQVPGKMQYEPEVARRAYRAMRGLLDEVFA